MIRTDRAGPTLIVAAAIAIAGLPCLVRAQESSALGARDAPPVEARYLGRLLPDVPLATTRGRSSLSALWRNRPVLVTLVFTRCAGVCSPYLRSLKSADEAVGAGRAYQRLVLSFDPRDTVRDVASVAAHLGVTDRDDWTFAVADAADVRRLAEAIGFWFAWDASRQQYDHPALLAAVRQGRVVRLLVGGSVTPARLSEVARDLKGEFVASYALPDRVRFRCFQYDPATGRTRLDWGFVLLLMPPVATIGATAGLFAAGGRARRPR